MMFKTIVVACNGSEADARAIELAEALRDREHGRLILVHVFPFFRGFAAPLAPVFRAENYREEAETLLIGAAHRVTTGVPLQTRAVASSSTACGLHDTAEDLGADLIVVGPTKHPNIGRHVGLTTAQHLLHGAPCAVASAVREQHLASPLQIGVAYDGTPEAAMARDAAYEIAGATGGHVTLFAAIEPLIVGPGFVPAAIYQEAVESYEHKAVEQLTAAATLAPEDVDVDHRIGRGSPCATLLRLADAEASLLVAGSRGYGPLHRLVGGSVSGALLTNARIPALVTPRGAVASAVEHPATLAAVGASG